MVHLVEAQGLALVGADDVFQAVARGAVQLDAGAVGYLAALDHHGHAVGEGHTMCALQVYADALGYAVGLSLDASLCLAQFARGVVRGGCFIGGIIVA